MKPYLHAKASVKKYGGKVEDYQAIHDFIDSSKAHYPDMRHRAILHSSFGIYITEQVFGVTMTNSDGKICSVRDIAEDHVIQDLGRIPTVQDYLEGMPFYEWLGGKPRKPRRTFTHGLEPIDSGNIVPLDEVIDPREMVIDTASPRLEEALKDLELPRRPFRPRGGRNTVD